ncbi:MAG: hypothetical protein IJW29_06600 [Clostridia bacterium]|nr:hypothetical protein [Clostridia bacterium]
MNRKITMLISAVLLLVTVLCMASCSVSEIEKAMEEAGAGQDGAEYTVSIRFDPNGGWLKGRDGVSIIEVYNAENGDFKIPDPADESKRGKDGLLRPSRTDYFLAGWYREREQIGTDENGEPIYTYSGKWDFENDEVKVDSNKAYSPDEPVMTLYAAWIPYMTYEFYAVDDAGNIELIDTKSLVNLQLPEWSQSSGKMDYNQFVTREGMTFEAAYADPECKIPFAEGATIRGSEYVDYETGTAHTSTVRVYSTWREGTWYKIHTADQFLKNFQADGHYIICADLDFKNKRWQTTDRTTSCDEFIGTIEGENGVTYKLSNITTAQGTVTNKTQWGLFGALGADSVIKNIQFENVTFTINTSQKCDGFTYFGLLAGRNNGATLESVAISGTLSFTGVYNPLNLGSEKCTFGKLFGIGDAAGIDMSGITYTTAENIGVVIEENADGSFTVTGIN